MNGVNERSAKKVKQRTVPLAHKTHCTALNKLQANIEAHKWIHEKSAYAHLVNLSFWIELEFGLNEWSNLSILCFWMKPMKCTLNTLHSVDAFRWLSDFFCSTREQLFSLSITTMMMINFPFSILYFLIVAILLLHMGVKSTIYSQFFCHQFIYFLLRKILFISCFFI